MKKKKFRNNRKSLGTLVHYFLSTPFLILMGDLLHFSTGVDADFGFRTKKRPRSLGALFGFLILIRIRSYLPCPLVQPTSSWLFRSGS